MGIGKPKSPKVELEALYVTPAGRRKVKVTPEPKGDSSMVSIGNESWTFSRNNVIPGKGVQLILVQGQGQAVVIWEKTALTAAGVDSIANDNLLSQIRDLSQGGRTNAVSWVQIGISAILILCMIGVGVMVNGDLADLNQTIQDTHSGTRATTNGPIYDPTVTVIRGDQTTGSLGQLNEDQTGGA